MTAGCRHAGDTKKAKATRLVVVKFMSLDGVAQAPGGAEEDREGGFTHGGWSYPSFDPATMGATYAEALGRADALLFGRRTWQVSAGAWPARQDDPFADRLNGLPKYVASRTLTVDEMTWNTTLLPADDTLGAIAELRQRDGGDLVLYGSPLLVRELLARDLVDELILMIEPIVLGGGKRLFADDGRAFPLELTAIQTSATGVHICTYRSKAER